MKPEITLNEVLEISPRASHEVVKATHRCLAQVHHPDKNVLIENGFTNGYHGTLGSGVKRFRPFGFRPPWII